MGNKNIRVIGPRGSGKTSYLAALAHWPDKEKKNVTLRALNDETRQLASRAKGIIEGGATLEPDIVNEEDGIDAIPFYSFGIKTDKLFGKDELITLSVRDYPGEIFEILADMAKATSIHKEFIEECLEDSVDGCLVLLSDWEKDKDSDRRTCAALTEFLQQMGKQNRLKNLRVAVALSKCERGELWPGRLDPKLDLFQRHLHRTTKALSRALPARNLRFYAVSTFGVYGRNDPRPNREIEPGKENTSTLRDREYWQPYGLLEPLYWLSRGD